MSDVDYDAWAKYIAGIFSSKCKREVRSVADIACGTGNISLRLAKMGCNVTGIDLSEDMLHIAQRKAREQGLKMPFVMQDMRSIALHKQMDAINCSCDGVNYLLSERDVKAFFSSAYASLKAGGMLCFDISTPYKIEHILDAKTFSQDEEDASYIWQNEYDAQTKIVTMNLTFFARRGDLFERFFEEHKQRAHSVQELTSWLKEEGFFDIDVYAFETFDIPDETCERLQFCAIKPIP